MNPLYKLWCRLFQITFKIVSPMMPWREPYIFSGEGSLSKLPAFIKEKGVTPVLIVTDKGLMSVGLLDDLIKGLKSNGVEYHIFDETVPNPTIQNVEDALAIYNKNNCKGIIAFGGGSPMDCAKGVGARVARPKKSMKQLKGLFKVLKALPPLIAIPTTAGTGSEATVAAVISNSETQEKYVINDLSLIPHYAVLDPLLTVKLPRHITAATGVDVLTHAVEAFIGKSNTKLTSEMAQKATKLVFENLKEAYDNGENLEARTNMLNASYYGGVAFTRAYVGYVHAIAHAIGGLYNTPHGLANAIILPYVLDAFGQSVHKPLAQLATISGLSGGEDSIEDSANKFIQAIRDLNKYMEIPDKIKNLKKEDFDIIAKRATKEANPLYPVPKLFGKKDIKSILENLLVKE